MPDKNKLSTEKVDPTTGLNESSNEKSLLDIWTEKGYGVKPLVNPNTSGPFDTQLNTFDPTQKKFEYTSNPSIDHNEVELNNAYFQSSKDRRGRNWSNFFTNMASSMAISALNRGDMESTFNTIMQTEREFDTEFLGVSIQDIMEWSQERLSNNVVYEKRPGKVNMSDPAWWGNQFSSAGTSMGMALYSGLETVAVTAATRGVGLPSALHKLQKIPQLYKIAKKAVKTGKITDLLDKTKKLRNTAITWGILNRTSEAKMESQYTYKEIFDELSEMRNPDGSFKFTEEEIVEHASKGALTTFNYNMPLMALDILTFRTMVFNPVSGKGTGLVEKGLEKIAGIYGKSKVGKWAGRATTAGLGWGLEGVEEGYQHIGSSEGSYAGFLSAGVIEETPYGERLYENATSDEFWNNFAGGVIGSPIVQGPMVATNWLANRGNRKKINNKRQELTANIGKFTTEENEKIRALEAAGKLKEATALRRRFGAENIIKNLQIDALKGDTVGYDNMVSFYETTLQQLEEGNIDALTQLGFDVTLEQVDKVKEDFKTFLKDAKRIKNIYDSISNSYDSAYLEDITNQQFRLETFIEEEKELGIRLENLKNKNESYNSLTTQGKRLFELENERVALNSVIENLKNNKNYDSSKQIKELEKLLENNKKEVAEIQKDEGYTKEQREEDSKIADSMVVTDYLMGVAEKFQLKAAIDKTRDQLSRWKDENFLKGKAMERIYSAKNIEELDNIEQEFKRTNSLTEAVKETIADRRKKILADEIARTPNPITTPNPTEQVEGDTSPIGVAVEALSGALEADELAVTELGNLISEISEDGKASLKDVVAAYIKKMGKERALQDFDKLVNTFNALPSVFFSDQHIGENESNKLKEEIFGEISQAPKTGVVENPADAGITTQEELQKATDKTEKTIEEQPQNVDSFTPEGEPIFLNRGHRTNEVLPKFAFVSRAAKQFIEKVEGEENTYISYFEYVGQELNVGGDVESLRLLDPDKYRAGTILTVRTVENPNEIIVPVYDALGNRTYVKFGELNLDPNSQEYRDKVPMIIVDEEGNSVAMAHDVDWYHPSRFTEDEPGDYLIGQENTRHIRNSVVKNGGAAKIKINSKRETTFEGLKVDTPITLQEANPESQIAIVDDLGNLKTGKNAKDIFKGVLHNKKELEPGQVYDIRRFGTDSEGNPTYIALPVFLSTVSPDNVETIKNVLELYLNQHNENIDSNTKERYSNIRKQVLSTLGLDLHSPKDLEVFLKQLIPTISNASNKPEDVAAKANRTLKIGVPYLYVDYNTGNIIFGITGEKMSKNNSAFSLGPNIFKSENPNITFMNNAMKKLTTQVLPNFTHNISLEGIGNNKPVLHITSEGVQTHNTSYSNYMKNTLTTNVKSVNIGTEANPKWVTNMQPIITYDLIDDPINPSSSQVIKKEEKKREEKREEVEKKIEEVKKESNSQSTNQQKAEIAKEGIKKRISELKQKLEGDVNSKLNSLYSKLRDAKTEYEKQSIERDIEELGKPLTKREIREINAEIDSLNVQLESIDNFLTNLQQTQSTQSTVEQQKADIERRKQGKDNKIENITYENGVYGGSFLDNYEFIAEGSESRVYRSKDGTHVIKISEPYSSKDEKLFNARITNTLLREIIGNSGLEVIGYYEYNGVKNPIFKQNFIDGKKLSEKEVVEHLKTIEGVIEIDGEFYYKYDNKLYTISDFSDNVIQDKNGNIVPIDLDVYEVIDNEINAKYDAELDSLNNQSQSTKQEVTKKTVKEIGRDNINVAVTTGQGVGHFAIKRDKNNKDYDIRQGTPITGFNYVTHPDKSISFHIPFNHLDIRRGSHLAVAVKGLKLEEIDTKDIKNLIDSLSNALKKVDPSIHQDLKKDKIIEIINQTLDNYFSKEDSQPTTDTQGEVKITPSAQKLIKDNNLNEEQVSEIRGSGEKGRILKKDVLDYIEAHKNPPPQPPSQSPVREVNQETLDNIDDIVKGLKDELGWLGDLDNIDEDNYYDPVEISDEDAQELASNIDRIEGLSPGEQYTVIDYIYNRIATLVDFDSKETVKKSEIEKTIKEEFDKYFGPIKEGYLKKLEDLRVIAEKYPEKAMQLKGVIRGLEITLNKIQSIENNFDSLTKLAESKIEKYTGISEVKSEENNKDNDNDGTSPTDETLDIDESNIQENSYDSNALQDNGKDKASARMKRFLGGIRDYQKDGTPKVGFFNLPEYIDFDTMYNTVTALLAGVPSNYTLMIEELKGHQKSLPWVSDLIEKLENTSQQNKNEFVTLMSKHALEMEFVMFSHNNEDGTYSLKVMSTNANSVTSIIQNSWYNNFKLSMTMEDGVTINKSKAKRLLDVFERWTNIKTSVIGNIGTLTPLLSKVSEDTPVTTTLADKKLKEDVDKKLSNNEKVTFKYKEQEYQINNAKDGKYIISTYTPTKITPSEIKNWLEEFGIELSIPTIEDMMLKGLYDGKTKKYIPFKNLFHKSDNTRGVFGVIANYLDKFANSEQDINIIEDALNPLQESVIRNLAGLESKHNISVISNSFRDGGKSLYGFTANKFITDRVRGLKNDSTLRENLGDISFSKGSLWLNILDTDEDFKDKFKVIHLGLTAFKELGKKAYQDAGIAALSDADHELTKIGLFQDTTQGKIESKINGIALRVGRLFSPTMSDKTTMTVLRTAVLDLQNKDLLDGKGMSKEVLLTLYEQLIKPELERIINFHRRGLPSNTKSYDKGATMFLGIDKLNDIEVEGVNILTYLQGIAQGNMPLLRAEQDLKSVFENILTDLVEQLVEEKLNPTSGTWVKNGYVDRELFKFLDSTYMSKFQGNNKDKIRMAAMDYIINNLIGNSNSFMTIIGDPANYYKTEKRKEHTSTTIVKDTFVNIGKRLANQIAPGITIADSNDPNANYIQLFIKDRESKANNYDYLVRLLGERGAKDYLSIEAADAQEYTTWKEHLYILEKLGRTPDVSIGVTPEEIREAREIFSKNKDLDSLSERQRDLIKKILQPIKPVYTGQIYDKRNDNMRVIYIKSSSIPLIPQLTQGFELDKLRVAMEKLEEFNPNKYTVRASYQTANKVGAVDGAIDLWDADGNIIEDNITTDKLLPNADLTTPSLILPRSGFRIQQDVPFKSYSRDVDVVTLGTQTTKLLFGNGIMDLVGFNFKEKLYTGKELQKIYNEKFIKLVNSKRRQLYSDLGVDLETNNPLDIEYTMKKLEDLLIKEAKDRGYPKQSLESLKLEYKRNSKGEVIDIKFTLPLWSSANSNKLESLLNAIVNSRVVKMKFPGYSYVVGSEEGFKFQKDFKGVDKSRIVFTNKWTGELKAANKTEDGHFSLAQVLLPSKFRDKNGKIIDFTSSEYSERDENGVLRLKEGKVEEALLSLTSFRIPTSGHVSMSQIEIVGFLPEESGDLLIVPKNFTKQMGLDFDIDKQNTYALFHEQDEDGNLKVLRNKYESQEVQDVDEQLNSFEFEQQLLINDILEIHSSVLSNPSDEVQSKIQKTLSIEYAKEQAAYIEELQAINKKLSGKEIFSPYSDEYQKQKMFLGSGGKIGTGAYSLDVVGHSLFQQAKANGKPLQLMQRVEDDEGKVYYIPKTFRFGNFTSDGSLGNSKTISGNMKYEGDRNTAEVLAERQNIAVDNEKEQVMGVVNLNGITLDVDKVFNLLSFDEGEDGNSIAFLFLSQPIIKKYVDLMKNSKSLISEYNPNKEQEVIDQLLDEYGGKDIDDINSTEYEEASSNSMTNTNMSSAISSTAPDQFLQRAVLRRFLEMKGYGETLRKVQTTINVDSKGLGKSFFNVISKREDILGLKNIKLIQNADALLGEYIPVEDVVAPPEGSYRIDDYYIVPNTLSGGFALAGIESAYQLWDRFFPYNGVGLNNVFKEILGYTGKGESSENTVIEAKQEIFKHIKMMLNSSKNTGLFTLNAQKERLRLFSNKNGNMSLANYIHYLRQNKEGNKVIENIIKTNKLLSRFEIESSKKSIDIIKFNNAASENFDEEYLYNAFIELMEKKIPLPDFNGQPYNTRLLAQDLINYAMLEGGIQEAIQFSKFIPVSYLLKMGYGQFMNTVSFDYNPIFTKLDENEPSIMALQYIQHNPGKIPQISNILESVVETNEDYTPNNLNSLKTFQLKDYDEPPTFISIYNKNLPTGDKKYQLYIFDGKQYNRIPVLGTFGLNEYSLEESNFYESIVNQKTGTPFIDILPPAIIETKLLPVNDNFNIQSKNINTILEEIVKADLGYFSTLAKELIGRGDVEIGVMDIFAETGRKANGKYNSEENKIDFDINNFPKLSREEQARVILHEYVHALTAPILEQYENNLENAPAHILKLNRLFNQAKKHIGEAKIEELREKFRNREGLTPEQKRVTYGVFSIEEFATMVLTQPEFQAEMNKVKTNDGKTLLEKFAEVIQAMLESLGVTFDKNTIATEGILTVLEIVENKVPPKKVNPFQKFITETKSNKDDDFEIPQDFNPHFDLQELPLPNINQESFKCK